MKQNEALDILKSGYNVFLTGAPGSGKTFLLNKYIKYLRKNNITVSVTASTGIAATHMGGTTLHSWSGIGIKEELDESEIKKICTKGYLRKKYL
jgi:predicted ATPase